MKLHNLEEYNVMQLKSKKFNYKMTHLMIFFNLKMTIVYRAYAL
jgi:hypothetical protein